ncbi:MAG: type IX secretion system protein PorQ [Prevotella sp.]|nr:type IX secretion system protein PorQ [Prevotella sp.]MCI5855491.1 type IX secretion system protein PorQ [Prevotella sp.]MDD6737554.1 type IX secretion system protein PorQ [Prevotella sp.]MDY6092308.1 type IX secretion system protein PorQ [Prevotella sp.]
MKKVVFFALFLALTASLKAQESETTCNFLRLPMSAHVSSLGGDNISIPDDDASLLFHNPALISNVTDKSLALSYMNYMEGVNVGGATFVKAWGERATWGVQAMYIDYGEMKQTTADNVQIGEVSAKEVMVGATLSYLLTDRIAGGVSTKLISSHIAGYSALAVGVDLGLNYYDDETLLSVAAVARNLGGQVKAFEDEFEKLPFDLQLGVSKQLVGAPLRFSATMTRLNSWDDRFINHLVVGADLLLSQQIFLAAGYNFRRADEMKISDGEGESSHGAALSLGAGLQLERFKLQVAYANYHVSTASLLFNVSYCW